MKGVVSLLFILTILGIEMADADTDSAPWKGPAQPVYVVTQNHYAEGSTPEGDSARFTDLILIQIYGKQGGSDQTTVNYPIGGRIGLYLRGSRRGNVTIKKVAPLQCDSTAAIVTAGRHIGFKKGVMALATNAVISNSHPDWSKTPDSSANDYARSLAAQELQRHGVHVDSTDKIRIDQLVVTNVLRSGPVMLIGALSFTSDGIEHDLFIIGEVGKSRATLDFSRYHDMKDLTDNTDIDMIRFVDQLDLDGDGVDELVLEETGYEDEGFEILKRQNGVWTSVWTGGGGGC